MQPQQDCCDHRYQQKAPKRNMVNPTQRWFDMISGAIQDLLGGSVICLSIFLLYHFSGILQLCGVALNLYLYKIVSKTYSDSINSVIRKSNKDSAIKEPLFKVIETFLLILGCDIHKSEFMVYYFFGIPRSNSIAGDGGNVFRLHFF